VREVHSYSPWMRGCLTAMNRGERNLDKLYHEENKTEYPHWNFTHRDDVENKAATDK
jgi:hypothetical protein